METPIKSGEVVYMALDKYGQPCYKTELYSSADVAIDEYVAIMGDDPSFVVELTVSRIGGFTRQVKWS